MTYKVKLPHIDLVEPKHKHAPQTPNYTFFLFYKTTFFYIFVIMHMNLKPAEDVSRQGQKKFKTQLIWKVRRVWDFL